MNRIYTMEKQIGITKYASSFDDWFWVGNPSCSSCKSCLKLSRFWNFSYMVLAQREYHSGHCALTRKKRVDEKYQGSTESPPTKTNRRLKAEVKRRTGRMKINRIRIANSV